MSGAVQRHFVQAGGLLWHYRQAGSRDLPTLVLLHPSPRSSAMFEPWMTLLAPHFNVLAPDTPGYGLTPALSTPPIGMGDYVAPLHDFLNEVTTAPPLLYGSATGAQLGIAYANAYANAHANAYAHTNTNTNAQPPSVRHLIVDNAAHFSDAQAQHILRHYFPDLTPQADGSHLHAAWQMCTQQAQFFPWFEANEAHRFSTRVPLPDEVQASLAELLAAGPRYADAYRAAFEHERAANVQALRVPTTVLRWQGSILLKHIDALLAFELPPNVQVLQVPAPSLERFATLLAHLLTLR
jgi:pimeloyl-ACP methyl ester carboxylesterase